MKEGPFDRDSLRGIIPPLATPLTPAEDVDRPGMARLVEHVLDGGVHGVFVLGATGEYPFLNDRQRAETIEAAVEAVAGRVPVIAGISAIGTRQAIANCRAAQAAGADFVIATVPYFGSMALQQDWIFEHLRAIAGETGAQVMLYNVPPLLRDMEPATIARLAEIDNVVGMKDSASLIHVQDVLFRTRERNFRVLAGLEYHLVAALMVGAHGGTPSPANLIPRRYVDLYERTMAGATAEALAIQEEVNRFSDGLDALPSWFSAVKAALHLLGICGPTAAAPLPRLTAEETEMVRAHLARSGLLP
jgi:4-hydroxy-tetrahydrodipicolinate synthase